MAMKIKTYEKYDLDCMDDVIACFAANVELAYLTSGCTEYTAKDCVDKAIYLLAASWREDKREGTLGESFVCSFGPALE